MPPNIGSRNAWPAVPQVPAPSRGAEEKQAVDVHSKTVKDLNFGFTGHRWDRLDTLLGANSKAIDASRDRFRDANGKLPDSEKWPAVYKVQYPGPLVMAAGPATLAGGTTLPDGVAKASVVTLGSIVTCIPLLSVALKHS